MDHISLSRYKISLMIMVFATLMIKSQSVSHKFTPCLPSKCGNGPNGPNISYPFWIPQQQEPYCGSPQFNVTCHDNYPILKLSDDHYIIKDINYANNSIWLANSELFNDENSCPTPLHNFSISGIPFENGPDFAELHFFYNCSFKYESARIILDCASNHSHRSFAVLHPEFLKKEYSVDLCQATVTTPITAADMSIVTNYTELLKKGFALKWNGDDCNKCVKSGGRCGSRDNDFICICNDQVRSGKCGNKKSRRLIIGIAIGGCTILLLSVLIIYCCRKKTKHGSFLFSQNLSHVDAFINQYGSSIPRRFRYSTIKKITNSFKDELGKGGYGTVYRGSLSDGRDVAVKVLNATKGNGEEFINEVASIGRTCHVNVVTLLGFCYEGRRRALVYEFMPNGSLEKFIYGTTPLLEGQHLGWEKLFNIAIGIAHGLEYLHRGCNIRILHFDIKPHNILLDKDFRPKISDFGLAKLYTTNESVVSSLLQARGTIGYIAPEVTSRNFGQVSHKSDVYSYGMMILEMVGGRKNVNARADHTSEIYYPRWLYKRVQIGGVLNLADEISEEENELIRKMVIVGLWCIQVYPSQRPSISKVIEMLEGKTAALEIPPKPYLCSAPSSPSNSQTKLVLCPASGIEPTSST